MQIFMVVKTEKPSDEWLSTNIKPYSTQNKADQAAGELNNTRSDYERDYDYLEYVVIPYEMD